MLCILVLFGLIILVVFKKWNKNDGTKLPEPRKWPIIGNTFRLFGLSDNIFDNLQAANKKYPIYKVSHPFTSAVNISNADDVQIFLSGKEHTNKSIIYFWLQDWLGTGLLTSGGKKWQYRRKLLTPAFHFNILQEFFKVIQEHSVLMVDKLQKECDKPYTDVFLFMSHSTLHIICETAMGIKLDESNRKVRDYVNTVQQIGRVLLRRIRRPWLYFDIFFLVSKNKRTQLNFLKILHEFTTSVIEQRKKTFKESDVVEYDENNGSFVAKKRLALLDLLLTLKSHGADITDEGIREEVDTFTFEGHDTTATSSAFALMLIANHEDVQNKIFDELQEITNKFNQTIGFEDLSKLRYLELVIKESLRLYPVVPTIGRRADHDVLTTTGYVVPKGINVGCQIYSIHHNEKYFPNPEKFDPNRFLPENSQGRHPYAYIPFSAGPRNCIGQRFAMMELKLLIASIVQHYKLIPIDSQTSIKMVTNLTLKTTDGVKVKFERRK